jgi:hypothetical protein
MRKLFFKSSAPIVGALMLHGAFACELNREANRQGSVVVVDCGTGTCMFDPPQDPLASPTDKKRTPPDPMQDCGAAYFDRSTYSGSNGLIDWLMATLGTQGQYQPGAGFTPSSLDANARYR